jgi:hypothetical protein
VLPGDFNDDGVVNSQDLVGVRNEWLGIGGATYTIFGDLNGDGVVNVTDYNDVRAELGTSLPTVVPPSPTLINFDNLPANGSYIQGSVISAQAQLSNQLENQGVIFSTGMGADYVAVVPLGLGHATSGTNGISMAATDNTVTYDAPDYTVIQFVVPSDPSVEGVTDFVSIRGDHAGSSNTLTMQAFDINGNLLGTDSQPDVGGETVSLSLPGIHSVHILTTAQGNSGGIGLDDLSFDTPVTAESPAAVTSQSQANITAAANFSLAASSSGTSSTTAAAPPSSAAAVSSAGLVSGAGASGTNVGTTPLTVTIQEAAPKGGAVRRKAELKSLHRAEVRLANRGHHLNLENHRRELVSSTGKELKRL